MIRNTHNSPGPAPAAGDERDARFDEAMRALHRQALDRVEPATRARLRSIRNDTAHARARRGGLLGWALASGSVAAVALALGLQFVGPAPPAPTASAPALAEQTPAIGYDADTSVAALDENPDLYLWLASNGDALPTQPE
ncbi:hypothetical protein ABU614_11950 [Lysobacter firmicutimachus]|uniref:DUF3619 family protein n=1 Tax=Lysobacter firmicutimachus TaxID=1792846 RepID=A0AAU8MQJ5_9GAMM|nr:hypothetical protein [Lysobacter antibioticus]